MLRRRDNCDSFVHNLARYFRRVGCGVEVRRSDAIEPAEIQAASYRAVVISPGPCTPREAGCSLDVVRQLHESVPIFGVCLGHQVIAEAMGAAVVRSPDPMHGEATPIAHDSSRLFAGIPSPLRAGRYHSLVVEEASLPAELDVTARSADGLVMALEHRRLPVAGVQFHPESILTEHGYRLLANFLETAGLRSAREFAEPAGELAEAAGGNGLYFAHEGRAERLP